MDNDNTNQVDPSQSSTTPQKPLTEAPQAPLEVTPAPAPMPPTEPQPTEPSPSTESPAMPDTPTEQPAPVTPSESPVQPTPPEVTPEPAPVAPEPEQPMEAEPQPEPQPEEAPEPQEPESPQSQPVDPAPMPPAEPQPTEPQPTEPSPSTESPAMPDTPTESASEQAPAETPQEQAAPCNCQTPDPNLYDGKKTEINKTFYKTYSPRLFHMPFSFAVDVNRAQMAAKQKGYAPVQSPMILDTLGMFWANIFVEIENAEPTDKNVMSLDGKPVYTKFSRSDWKDIKLDIAALEAEAGQKPQQTYVWWTSCPKCVDTKEVKAVIVGVL